MKIFKAISLSFISLFSAGLSFAAEPAGYYSSCENRGGQSLLTALHDKISDHTTISYGGLWTLYKTSDVDENGKIWDMYSTKRWSTSEQCGNYSSIGDCYNREHSMPKSWFNDASPMYSDAFHLYPTDGYVNNQRSNYPFGECAGGQQVKPKGDVKPLGRLGKSTFSGYSGTVFEPDDQYKGDFARSYFYMAACYYDRIGTWKSDMLAGNGYPAFKPWAIDLLLKWHRQDPVSKKETDRNEVVYRNQHNRNPFIDHPEMVEYIWGDKKNEKWSSTASSAPVINRPVSGSTLNVGVTAVGYKITKTVNVLTSGAKDNVTVAVSGAGFTVSPATVSASAANGGADVTVTFVSSAVGSYSGSLTVSTGGVKSTVNLTASVVDGLPVSPAENITEESFTAVWTYIGDADAQGCYTLTVADDAGVLDGYPRKVNAAAGRYEVTDLNPWSDYRYSLRSESYVSDYIDVRTAEAVPSIDFLYDGELYLVSNPGEPSVAAEILISTVNIEGDFTVSVNAPFELSADNSSWSRSVTLSADESRMYIRLNSAVAGAFESPIRGTYGKYMCDNAVVRGLATSTASFVEDFEAEEEGMGNYTSKTYHGTAAVWHIFDGGIYSSDKGHDSPNALRMGKKNDSSIEMTDGRAEGLGKVSFYACEWPGDGPAVIAVEYSTDEGITYKTAGTVTVDGNDYKEYAVHVGAPSGAKLRLRQTDGGRLMIDDIAITDNFNGVADADAERHLWNAYSHHGTLFVDVRAGNAVETAIYSVDGTTLFSGMLGEGSHSFDSLMPGKIYIVVSGDFSRTVMIR